MAGCSEQNLLGKDLTSLTADETRTVVEGMIREALDLGRRVSGREVLINRPDGARLWAELTLLPTSNGHKGLQGALRDVSDKKMTDAIRAILSGTVAVS